jgi:L-fuculose-phosphate aldolase
MNPNFEPLVSKLIKFGKSAKEKELIWATSGNISCRLSNESFIISCSGAALEDLKEDDFVVLDLHNIKIEGEKNPSIESKMHSAVYRVKPEANCVFHSQAFFTTLLSCTDFEVNPNLFPETMAYLKKVGRVPYNHPGSQELADDVSDKVSQFEIIILNNHGALCAGSSLSDVLLKTETLEMVCKMMVFSRVSEINLNFLPQNLKEDLLKHLKQIKDTM